MHTYLFPIMVQTITITDANNALDFKVVYEFIENNNVV